MAMRITTTQAKGRRAAMWTDTWAAIPTHPRPIHRLTHRSCRAYGVANVVDLKRLCICARVGSSACRVEAAEHAGAEAVRPALLSAEHSHVYPHRTS